MHVNSIYAPFKLSCKFEHHSLCALLKRWSLWTRSDGRPAEHSRYMGANTNTPSVLKVAGKKDSGGKKKKLMCKFWEGTLLIKRVAYITHIRCDADYFLPWWQHDLLISHSFSPTAVGWSALTFCTGIGGAQRMNPANSDCLTFPLLPQWCWLLSFKWNVSIEETAIKFVVDLWKVITAVLGV